MGANIMVVAGEASGDLHCSRLVTKINEFCPTATFFGMGGKLMAKAGVELEYDIADSAVMGFTEVIGKIPMMLNRLKGLKRLMVNRKPDVIVFVDFPDFSMRLLSSAHKHQIPVVYYIPPKAWAWRKKRANVVAKYTSAVANIFPFAADVYKKAGANAHYVGHPLVDFASCSMSKAEAYKKFHLDSESPIIGLMPGSRNKEIKSLLPVILDSAKLIRAKIPDCQFILPIAHTLQRDSLPDLSPLVTAVDGSYMYDIMNICDMAIVASGTVTLEAAYMVTPMIVIYKVSAISWYIINMLTDLTTSALPNIVVDKMIVPELLQKKVNPNTISGIAIEMMLDPKKLSEQRDNLEIVRERLGNPGAVERTAKLVLQFV